MRVTFEGRRSDNAAIDVETAEQPFEIRLTIRERSNEATIVLPRAMVGLVQDAISVLAREGGAG